MLKIRYNTESYLLSGWEEDEAKFSELIARQGEKVALLPLPKPDVDDYEYYLYIDGELIDNPDKQPQQPEPVRDLAKELDELKAEVEKLKVAK